MAQSRAYKKRMNFVYGIGAAVVIIGALFKIQHITLNVFGLFEISGGLMLTIGLIAEAIVFAISAFDTPEDDLDWSKVYPELGEDGFSSEKEQGAEGLLSQKLDNLLADAKIDSSLMESLGTSMKNFQGAAEGLSAASESISSTNKYNEQMSMAAVQMESLNGLYKVQVENSSKQAELNTAVVENTERLKEQMDSLAKNLSSLNGVYGGMLSAMSSK
jgi:gliding motility-associated protein GldL